MIFYFKTWILHLLINLCSILFHGILSFKPESSEGAVASVECREEGWNLKRGLGRAVKRITSVVSVDAIIERELFA